MPEFETLAWAGMFGPANMPPEVVNVLARELQKMLAKPDAKERFLLSGVQVQWQGPQELADFVKAELVQIHRHDQGSRHRAGVIAVATKLKVFCARSMTAAVNELAGDYSARERPRGGHHLRHGRRACRKARRGRDRRCSHSRCARHREDGNRGQGGRRQPRGHRANVDRRLHTRRHAAAGHFLTGGVSQGDARVPE